MAPFDLIAVVDRIAHDGVSIVVGVPTTFAALLRVIERRNPGFVAPALRLCLCGEAPRSATLQARWVAATGVELRQGDGLTDASSGAHNNLVPHEKTTGQPTINDPTT